MITNIGARASIQGAINATHASRISHELIKKEQKKERKRKLKEKHENKETKDV